MPFSASLSRRLEEASARIKSHKGQVRIVSHYDPDGIGAAAVICQMVRRLGLNFRATLSKNLTDEMLAEIRSGTPEEQMIIFTDMGSAKISILDDFPHSVIIIDHHQPESEGKKVIHLNPHLFGMDGGREASGSSFALSLAITVDPTNWDMIGPALAGAVGDRQSLGGFTGYNEDLVIAGTKAGLLKVEMLPNIKGGTIYDSLIESPEPYFKGITGRKREASRFIKWMDMEKEAKISDLNDEKRRFFNSICTLRLLRQGATPEAVGDFITTRCWINGWNMYADELSSLFNSCSRQGEQTLGLALALGDAAARQRAIELEKAHREFILTNLRELEAEPPKAMENIQYFMNPEVNYAGALAGLGALYFLDTSKATIGMAEKDGTIHVSARAPRALVKRGLNLGAACKEAAEKLDGAGGGHDIAAGATFPLKSQNKFLKEMDRIVGEQLAAK